MPRNWVFWPSEVIEQKLFFQTYPCILVISRIPFLHLPLTRKSLILVTNWKVHISLSTSNYLTHCNCRQDKLSTQSIVKHVFTVSIQDTFQASSFSLTGTIFQFLVTSSRLFFSFRLNMNSAMSIWTLFSNRKTLSVAFNTPF